MGVDLKARVDPGSGSRKLDLRELKIAKTDTLAGFLPFTIILLLGAIAPLETKSSSGSLRVA